MIDGPPPSPARTRLDEGYALRGIIATGGWGVYLARTVAGGQPVVVKMLRPELTTGPDAGERYRREVC
jgi:hypothetical protein